MIKQLIVSRFSLCGLLALTVCIGSAQAQEPALESIPNDPFFAGYQPTKAPANGGLLLKQGDRLAIIGDSITEQKIYSRIIESYLTACAPELNVTIRQYGWSGETAEGFLHRMTNDCLRFQPTVATLCYGMNDHRYKAYEDSIGNWYSNNYAQIVRSFRSAGTRVVLGSPGCVGKMPSWVKTGTNTLDDLNRSLCTLRNIDICIAQSEGVRFADVFWPMFTTGFDARKKFGPEFAMAGKDGVHPGGAGHAMMARAFLKSMGLSGEIGTYTVDLGAGTASASQGHKVDSFKDGVLTVTSRKYPFCATGAENDDNSIRAAMALVPFNSELNRLMLVVKGATAQNYKVTWGKDSRVYTASELAAGVNLANDFAANPFSEAFGKVDAAVLAKQNYETRQIKDLFHGEEGRADMEGIVAVTEKARERLAKAIPAAFVPVTHTISVEAQ